MKLFEPADIGKLSIKNRIIMAPMGVGTLVEPEGKLSCRGVDYFRARARGGVGLLITGAVFTTRSVIPHRIGRPMADDPMYTDWLCELAEAVHEYGAKVAVQLTVGSGRVGAAPTEKVEPVAPSSLPCSWDKDVLARELTRDEIKQLGRSFRVSAAILKKAGIDAIELHAHEGVLFDQFQTALWNHRGDEYGGDLNGRLRFAREVIENIREGAGADFPIIYRFGLTHYLQGGREVEEGVELAQKLENMVDAFHVDAGCYETWYWPHPPTYQPSGCMVNLAEIVKKAVHIPVIAVGKLGNPELAEQVLVRGRADFIALGRPLLADAEWPNKVKEGRLEDIIPCIGCHYCFERTRQRKFISCAVNPTAGAERDLAIRPAEKKKSVLVVGGGPGGMEAARVAALRGHEVVLWEKSERLGGNLIAASVPSFKQDYRGFLKYLSTQVAGQGVDIRLGQEATPELILRMNPDVVFVATGGVPTIPRIPGVEKKHVLNAIDLLLGKGDVGGSVLVVGGGLVGCETALFLAERGKIVTIAEALDCVAGDAFLANRMHLLKLLGDVGVNILTATTVLEIREDGASVAVAGKKTSEVKADTVVIAVGLQPNTRLLDTVRDKVPDVYAVGDCVEPRMVMSAIWEGFHAALHI